MVSAENRTGPGKGTAPPAAAGKPSAAAVWQVELRIRERLGNDQVAHLDHYRGGAGMHANARICGEDQFIIEPGGINREAGPAAYPAFHKPGVKQRVTIGLVSLHAPARSVTWPGN
jgi:hypothetical protein